MKKYLLGIFVFAFSILLTLGLASCGDENYNRANDWRGAYSEPQVSDNGIIYKVSLKFSPHTAYLVFRITILISPVRNWCLTIMCLALSVKACSSQEMRNPTTAISI